MSNKMLYEVHTLCLNSANQKKIKNTQESIFKFGGETKRVVREYFLSIRCFWKQNFVAQVIVISIIPYPYITFYMTLCLRNPTVCMDRVRDLTKSEVSDGFGRYPRGKLRKKIWKGS